MPEVQSTQKQDETLFVHARDSLGRIFTFQFIFSSGVECSLSAIYLPDGVSWNLEVFQEMVDVRDVVSDFLKNNQEYVLEDAQFELNEVFSAEENPMREE